MADKDVCVQMADKDICPGGWKCLPTTSDFRATILALHCIPNQSNNYISFLSFSQTTTTARKYFTSFNHP